MNYIELVQRLVREAGMPRPGPTNVTGSTNAEWQNAIDWIADADLQIQLMKDQWRFMWAEFEFQTVAGQASYTQAQVLNNLPAGTEAQSFDSYSGRYFLTAQGQNIEQYMTWREWDNFRDIWLFGPNRTAQGQPQEWTFSPDRKVYLAQVPNNIYTVRGQVFRQPLRMNADTDVPRYPARYHMLAVWWALVNYAGLEQDGAVYQHALNMQALLLGPMLRTELPTLQVAGSSV